MGFFTKRENKVKWEDLEKLMNERLPKQLPPPKPAPREPLKD